LTAQKGKNGPLKTASFDKSVANFFDTEGNLLYDLLEQEVLKIHSNITSGKKEK